MFCGTHNHWIVFQRKFSSLIFYDFEPPYFIYGRKIIQLSGFSFINIKISQLHNEQNFKILTLIFFLLKCSKFYAEFNEKSNVSDKQVLCRPQFFPKKIMNFFVSEKNGIFSANIYKQNIANNENENNGKVILSRSPNSTPRRRLLTLLL